MKKPPNALDEMKRQVFELISKSYPTVEQFCWDNDLNKATVSSFLNGKKDFQVSTLIKLAKALKLNLIIRLERP